ncbi:MAG: hypothetical protein HOI47_04285 [Candidatus Scalindua sp.]|jgi:hypothetical protein|nr:hypothetical protein [Candidatus Scalindua sp.]MBT6225860.1 hypothetical protein [Candidatus Scalindua sp.]
MTNKISLMTLVKQECSNYVLGKCIGVDMTRMRFRKEESTKIFYQYPYEFEYKISESCWIEEGKPCSFFVKCVLPLAPELIEKYSKPDSYIQVCKTKRCKCGKEIDSNKRKCVTCIAYTRKQRNRRFNLDGLEQKTPL